MLRVDQGTNLGKEEKSPRFQAVNEQENILDLTTKHKKPTRFETCCTNASHVESGVGKKNSVSTHDIEVTIGRAVVGFSVLPGRCHTGERNPV